MERQTGGRDRELPFVVAIVAGAGCVLLLCCIALFFLTIFFFGVSPGFLLRSGAPSPVVTIATITPTTTRLGESPTPTVMPTATAAPTVTTIPTQPSASAPTGQIVFTCFIDDFDDICRIDADGSNEQRLTAQATTDFYPEWGPDGDLITYSSSLGGEFHIYLMAADGSEQRPVVAFGSLFAPDISPDGQQIVFTNAAGETQDIWIADLDGNNARQLTDTAGNDVDPVWSPDGAQIAFASDRSGITKHYVMDADGGNMRLLEDNVPMHGGRSDWSPDGRWLAFYAGPRDDRDIYLVATDGSGATQRLTEGGRNLAPTFSPDGNWIAFTSYRAGGEAEIYMMRADGSDVRQLTFNNRADWQPRWSR